MLSPRNTPKRPHEYIVPTKAITEEENLGHSIQKIVSKFSHSSEFRVFSLENIENLVLNLRPGSVYKKYFFSMAQVFPSLNHYRLRFLEVLMCRCTFDDLPGGFFV